tara:strand:- start:399 stop:632 length:234 start_codon:yes stop_codon:yes gene_type:complete
MLVVYKGGIMNELLDLLRSKKEVDYILLAEKEIDDIYEWEDGFSEASGATIWLSFDKDYVYVKEGTNSDTFDIRVKW